MIRLMAPISQPSSVGYVARALLAHVRAAGLPVCTTGNSRDPAAISTLWYHGQVHGNLARCPDVLGFQTDQQHGNDALRRYAAAKFIYCPSKWNLDIARSCGVVGEAAVVPHGLDDKFCSVPAEPPAPFRFLLVAAGGDAHSPGVTQSDTTRQRTYLERKGLDAVARAWRLADTAGAMLSVVTHLSAVAIAMLREHGFDGTLSVVEPPADDTEWPVIYQSAHAVLMPSCTEAFGLPALQALACGVPMAMTRECIGAADVVQPEWHALVGQWSAGQPDIESLATAMTSLRRGNVAWRDKARDASRVLRGGLSWEKVAAPVIDALRACESC